MKQVLTALLSLTTFLCFAQTKKMNVYLLKNDGKYVELRDSADYIRTVTEPDSGSQLYNIVEYYLNGKKKLIGKSSKIDPPVFEGQCARFYKNGARQGLTSYRNGLKAGVEYEFYPNGKLYQEKEYPDNNDQYNDLTDNFLIKTELDSLGTKVVDGGNGYYKSYDATFKSVVEEGSVKDGKKEGAWKGYFKNVGVAFNENYKDGKLVDGTATFKDGTTSTYTRTRGTPPQYKGGLDAFYQYLGSNIVYPTDERQNNIQGRVILTFIVEKDGSLSEIKVIKSVSRNIDDEAVRVMKNCRKWLPGTQFGQPARVFYTQPINFALSN